MMVDTISAVMADKPLTFTESIKPAATQTVSFLNELNNNLNKSTRLLATVASGGQVPSHEMMLAFEVTKQQLQLAVELRNKAVEAYQELMRTQL
jgi:flagellar hook-basal body complex protein FliE